jgi:Uncharacterised protein family (UPF0158)
VAHDQWRRGLRIAVAQHDADAIAGLLDEELPDDGLQHAGNALLCALATDQRSVPAVANGLVDALRNRLWDGDDALADAIDAVRGRCATTLTPLDLELEFIADALTEPAGSVGYLDLHTGFVITEAMLDDADLDNDTDFEDRSRWLAVPGEGSDEPYRDMQHFIATVTDPGLAQRLTHAINGRGAFRRFHDLVATAPTEHTRWQRFSDDKRLGRTRKWLADHGYQPTIR